MSADYSKALRAAIQELGELMNRRDQLDDERETIDGRIVTLRDGLFGLAKLCGMENEKIAERFPHLFPDLLPPDIGLTDAVRQALNVKRTHASPVEVRDRLDAIGFNRSKHKNILPSIHTVLKRLVLSGEAEEGNREGKVVYRAKPPAVRAPNVMFGGDAAAAAGRALFGSADGGAKIDPADRVVVSRDATTNATPPPSVTQLGIKPRGKK